MKSMTRLPLVLIALALLLTNTIPPAMAADILLKQSVVCEKDLTVEGTFNLTGAQSFNIDLQSQVRDDTGIALAASASSGKFGVTNGTHAAPALKLVGAAANSGATATQTTYASFVATLPSGYKAGEDVTITVTVDIEGAGTATTNTVDLNVYRLAGDGTVGSDINATAAQALAATPTARAFTVTGTTLNPGDKVLVYLTTVLTESAGSNINAAITDIKVGFGG